MVGRYGGRPGSPTRCRRRSARPSSPARALVDPSTASALAAVAGPDGLPPASPDYWEVRESAHAGDRRRAARRARGGGGAVTTAGDRLGAVAGERRRALLPGRSPATSPRTATPAASAAAPAASTSGSPSCCRPSPPRPAARARFAPARPVMSRPAGGLAPGGSWQHDGISWTPTRPPRRWRRPAGDPSRRRPARLARHTGRPTARSGEGARGRPSGLGRSAGLDRRRRRDHRRPALARLSPGLAAEGSTAFSQSVVHVVSILPPPRSSHPVSRRPPLSVRTGEEDVAPPHSRPRHPAGRLPGRHPGLGRPPPVRPGGVGGRRPARPSGPPPGSRRPSSTPTSTPSR